MKSKSTKASKNLINEIKEKLTWSYLERDSNMPVIRVTSDVEKQTHYIHMPDELHNKSGDLDFLHELGHATLCESVHPIFATNGQFPGWANKKQFLPLLPALSAACDWFVCHWQNELMPKEMQAQINESMPIVEEILSKEDLPPIEIILDSALIIAEAILYYKEPIDCDGPLKNIVEAFLSIPPDKPSEEAGVLLINKLLATYTDLRARLVPEGDISVWEIYQQGAAA
jgi:hypothetical protein